MRGNGAIQAIQAVLALYTAIRDSRISEARALVDPEVLCYPLVRPGLTVYQGHNGMPALVKDMHALHGDYQVDIRQITRQGSATITVQARIEPDHDRSPLPVTTVFTLRQGRITSISSEPGAAAGLG
jgi:SnoaL-like domain